MLEKNFVEFTLLSGLTLASLWAPWRGYWATRAPGVPSRFCVSQLDTPPQRKSTCRQKPSTLRCVVEGTIWRSFPTESAHHHRALTLDRQNPYSPQRASWRASIQEGRASSHSTSIFTSHMFVSRPDGCASHITHVVRKLGCK